VTNKATKKCKLCNVRISEDVSSQTPEWVKQHKTRELDDEAMEAIIKVIFGKPTKLKGRRSS
jgi:hypothetical protein